MPGEVNNELCVAPKRVYPGCDVKPDVRLKTTIATFNYDKWWLN